MTCTSRLTYARTAIEVGGDHAPAIAHYLLGNRDLRGLSRDYTAAAGHFRRAITIAAATGDVMTQAVGVGGLGLALAFLGEVSEARRLIPEAIQRAERLGNPTILAVAYLQAGVSLDRIGAPQEAAVMFERCLVHVDAGGPNVASNCRVLYALSVDNPHEAAQILRAAIPIGGSASKRRGLASPRVT